jgi:hypothetical protein
MPEALAPQLLFVSSFNQVQRAAVRKRDLEAPGFLNCVDEAGEMALAAGDLIGCTLDAFVAGDGVTDQRCCLHDDGTLFGQRLTGLRPIVLWGVANLLIAAGRAAPQAQRFISVEHFIDLASKRYHQLNTASSAKPL